MSIVNSTQTFVAARSYRDEIDGLRAIAVLSVTLFHLGFLPNGYLGVDIFFVISGFLITGIIYGQYQKDKFSVKAFYVKRFRRILPLVLVVSACALALGMATMLPDDLESLAQSVIATSAFANNVLSYLTVFDYWDVWNEYKPLMHTWSLGIEEQYYFLYPLLFVAIPNTRILLAKWVILIAAAASLALYIWQDSDATKFYLLHYRFFELAIGGLAAIYLNRRLVVLKSRWTIWLALIGILSIPFDSIPAEACLISTVSLTCLGLSTVGPGNTASSILISRPMVWIGKLSFSLYMWHQLVLAFTRYLFVQDINYGLATILVLLTFALSWASYLLVEEPFRRGLMSNRSFLTCLAGGYLILCSVAFYVYKNGGAIRDVPELDIIAGKDGSGLHSNYNDRVHQISSPFSEPNKIKIFVVGNSFARDFVNVLRESTYEPQIELSYSSTMEYDSSDTRWKDADYILVYPLDRGKLAELEYNRYIDTTKLRAIGTKSFGVNNGVFYNSNAKGYCDQTTHIPNYDTRYNQELRQLWRSKYIDLLKYVTLDDSKVRVFTTDCKFFSQDTRHLTIAGAKAFADFISQDASFFLNRNAL